MSTKPYKKYKFLDLSGYAFTGKHAVTDLIREFEGYYVPSAEFEFNLIRIQGGIRDLETSLVDDWSPVRSDAAIRRFKKLIRRLRSRTKLFYPQTWFSAIGSDYDGYFKKHFFDLSTQYVEKLFQASWSADWPYPLVEISDRELFLRKIKRLLKLKRAFFFQMYLAAPQNFLQLTKEYLNDLLSSNVGESIKTIVMHNAFEPFYPQRSLRYFDSAKSIIIDRDPRDNFVAQAPYTHLSVSATVFIERYKLYRQIAKKYDEAHPDILRIRFEDLVTRYTETKKAIIAHLHEDESIHVLPKKYFNPEVSLKNIGIWRNYFDQDSIALIHDKLREFCYE